MERTIQKYKQIHAAKLQHDYPQTISKDKRIEYWEEETAKLKKQNDSLSNSIRQLMGEALTSLTTWDLRELEIKLQRGLCCIRSKKEEKLFEEIDILQTKEYLLQAHNDFLTTKIAKCECYARRSKLQIFPPGGV